MLSILFIYHAPETPTDHEGINAVPKRTPLDSIVHGHGEPLTDFMQDVKMCVLNGRLKPENDNYTCISPRGASFVDYIM